MERLEVIISDGDGLQSTQTLFERVMAVCFIQTVITVIKDSKKRERLKRGTGFYSKLTLDDSGDIFGVFTNNHVLSSISEAENAFATFGYDDASGGQKVKLRPEIIFRTNKELDYTFVGFNKSDIEDLKLKIQPILMEPEPELKKDDGIFIFQHPKGQPKQYSQDKILHVERPFVFYKADTETGSSGSPVLTTVGLKLVGIHHKGSEELSYNKGTLCSEVLRHLSTGTYTQPPGGYSDNQDKEIFEDDPPAKKLKLESKESQQPSEDDLADLAKDITPFWKHLGRKLKIPDSSIAEIQSDNIQFPGIREKAFQMLMVWMEREESATFGGLSKALIALEKNRLAKKYCTLQL